MQTSSGAYKIIWSEIFKFSFLILFIAIVGAFVAVKWRKDLPKTVAIEAVVTTRMPGDLLTYHMDRAQDLKLVATNQGSYITRLVAESSDSVNEKFQKWVDATNIQVREVLGSDMNEFVSRKERMSEIFKKTCASSGSTNIDGLRCLLLEREIFQMTQDIAATEVGLKGVSIRVIELKPFMIQVASFPLRDAAFGFVVGLFLSVMGVSFFIYLKRIRKSAV